MEETVVVMLRNKQTGFLEKELCALHITECADLLTNIYAEERTEGPGGTDVHMRVSTGPDVEDWQFNAVFDYYDDEALAEFTTSVAEAQDVFNPAWDLVFPCPYGPDGSDDPSWLEEALARILRAHKAELQSVFKAIRDVEREYREEAGET